MLKHVKMPDFVADVVGHPVKFPFVEIFYGFNLVHWF